MKSATVPILIRSARPHFLIAGLALYVFGAAWAVLLGASFSLSRTLLGYLVFLLAHLSVSYSNEYFDVDVDKYGQPTLFSGGSGILANRPELREPAHRTALILIFLSLALGIVLQIAYSLPFWFLVLVVLGNLLGWFYSAPPLCLAYHGLGELSMAVSIGLIIPGLAYLVTNGQINQDGLLFTLPMILYGVAFISAVEIPDMESDRLGGKRTWIARKGRGFGFTVIATSFFLATIFFFVFPLLTSRSYPVDFRFLGILTLLPLGAGAIGLLSKPEEQRLATRIVYAIIITFGAFCVLVDWYMVHLILR